MIIKNIEIYTEEGRFVPGALRIEEGQIAALYEAGTNQEEAALKAAETAGETVCDGADAYAIPGLIDLHFHGCMGDDFCDGNAAAIARIAAYEASVGVTAIAPATMTLPVRELEEILRVAAAYQKEGTPELAADLVGINMEGPFISPAKKGAQDARNILPCDEAVCRRFLQAAEGLVKFMGIAPEESEHALAFIEKLKNEVNFSLAHTNADYDTAMAAFAAGANHAVHLFNAMPPFTHRDPGVVGAVADSPHVMAELICDGVHIHPAMVRTAFRMLGKERIIFISDSMRATGMPDGSYTLGGLAVNVRGNRATLASDGALAGSVTNLYDCMCTAVKQMGIPLETAVGCATKNPAVSLGIYEERGSLSVGKRADLVLMERDLSRKAVLKDGKLLAVSDQR